MGQLYSQSSVVSVSFPSVGCFDDFFSSHFLIMCFVIQLMNAWIVSSLLFDRLLLLLVFFLFPSKTDNSNVCVFCADYGETWSSSPYILKCTVIEGGRRAGFTDNNLDSLIFVHLLSVHDVLMTKEGGRWWTEVMENKMRWETRSLMKRGGWGIWSFSSQ